MKLKQVASICKASKSIILYSGRNGTQWIGNGGSLYPLYNVMRLNEETIYAIFDITEKQQEKMTYAFNDYMPEALNLADAVESETRLEQTFPLMNYNGNILRPLKTSLGILFIDTKYLAPLSEKIELFERISNSGTQYIVAKLGLMLVAVIMPANIITESFVENIKELSSLCRIALQNKSFS